MLAALLPFAAGTSLVWKHGTRAGRLSSLVLLGLSVLAAASRVWGGDGWLLLPDSENRNKWLDWLSPVVDLTPGLPGYFSAPVSLPSDALVWMVVMAVSLGVGRWVVLRIRWRETAQATACVAAAYVGAMGAIEVLWARSQAVTIAPAASQLGLLTRARDHGVTRVLDVSRAAWLDVGDALARLRIGSDRLPSRAENPGLQVSGVPPGRFLVETSPRDLPRPRLALWIGRSSDPLEEWPRGQAGRPATWELTLPAGAAVVTARAASARSERVPSVSLRPMTLFAPPGNVVDSTEVARRGARYGDIHVFAFEDHVWLEPQGVWVAGGRAGRLVLSAPNGQPAFSVTVRAGPPGAHVRIDGPGLAVARLLGSLESMTVGVPADARSRASWITVRTDRGFWQSDVEPGSRDRRFLGCWVTFQ